MIETVFSVLIVVLAFVPVVIWVMGACSGDL